MNDIEVTSLSSKGQIIIPNLIRNQLHLKSGAKFVILTDGSNILLKPIEVPKLQEFDLLITKARKFRSNEKLTHKKIRRIVKEVRITK